MSRPRQPEAPTSSRPGARPATTAPGAPATSTARAQRENVFVTSIVVAFVLLTVAATAVRVSDGATLDRSRDAISGTLTTVHQQQKAFRILNQRFASWPELRARGMTLPVQQRVVASNASQSHWYMAVRDTETGIVCSRTGELFDANPLDRRPSCSDSSP